MDFKEYLREEERVDEILPLVAGAARVLPALTRTVTAAVKPGTQALQTATKVTKNVGRVTKPIKAVVGGVKKVGQELGATAQQQTNNPEERLGEEEKRRPWIPYVRSRGGEKLTQAQIEDMHRKRAARQAAELEAMEQASRGRRTQSIRDALAKRKRRHGGGDSSEGDEG